jgi:hypothetical protein
MTAATDRRCEWCGAPIWFLRPQAKFCQNGGKCRKAAHLERKRSARGNGTVLAVEDGYFEALDATRGYLDDWRPQRKTQVMLSRVQQVLDEYREHLPLTCRQIYYRMIGAWNYPKGERFERTLYNLLDNARRAGEIPFDHIRDDGILSCGGFWYGGVDHFLHNEWRASKGYKRDVQDEQDVRLQVWCEAAGMIPQLRMVCDQYSIPVFSCGGFNSLTAVRQIMDDCSLYDQNVLLHLGDCDPSGYSIYQAVYEDVSAFLEAECIYDAPGFDAERAALTFDQVDEFNLEADEIKTNDTRSKIWRERGITQKVEIEALPPDQVAKLLTEAIERHLDEDALETARRKELKDKIAIWRPEPRCQADSWDPTLLIRNLRQNNNGRRA